MYRIYFKRCNPDQVQWISSTSNAIIPMITLTTRWSWREFADSSRRLVAARDRQLNWLYRIKWMRVSWTSSRRVYCNTCVRNARRWTWINSARMVVSLLRRLSKEVSIFHVQRYIIWTSTIWIISLSRKVYSRISHRVSASTTSRITYGKITRSKWRSLDIHTTMVSKKKNYIYSEYTLWFDVFSLFILSL